MQQIDTDAVAGDALLTDPQVIALYEAVRAAIVEDGEPGSDPVAAITRLGELMKAGDRDAAVALFILYDLDEKMRRGRRARRTKAT